MGAALPSLVRWGLSPDADLVYRTLVSLDTAREGQLAHELGLPHERIREAVRELAEAGAIRRVSSTSRRSPKATGRAVWAARQPNQVVGQLHVNRPRAVRPAAGRFAPPPAAPTNTPAPAFHADDVTAVPVDVMPESLIAPVPEPTAVVATEAKRPARTKTPSPRKPPEQQEQAAGNNCQLLATWQPGGREQPQVTLTPRERAIVELLAQGHTDETAARELDLSRRTVGYALGGLMSRLGVDNRFQLGLALGVLRAAVPAPRERSEG